MRNYIAHFIILFTLISLGSCHSKHMDGLEEKKLAFALKYAKANSTELQKVIDFYSVNDSDSLKLQAAVFLISNMPGKGWESFVPTDDHGKIIRRDFLRIDSNHSDPVLNYTNYQDSAKTTLKFVRKEFVEDIHVISADYLIQNIDYAFKTWSFPWVKSLTFDDFKQYILPYRIRQEPLQNWRKSMYEYGLKEIKEKGTPENAIQMACLINGQLKKRYKYLHNNISFYPGRLSFKEIETLKGGRCDDLNAFAGCLMRAIGVPVSMEFTPNWANSNYGGHSWLGILQEGAFTPMNAVYDNPIPKRMPFKQMVLAKAYRESFVISDTGAYKLTSDINPVIDYVDITSEYINAVSKVSLQINSGIFDLPVYLAVLNADSWRPVAIGTIEKHGKATFKDLAKGVLYSAIQNINGKFQTVTLPFIIDENGKTCFLRTNRDKVQTISLRVSFVSKYLFNKQCSICIWDGEFQDWIKVGEAQTLLINPSDSASKFKVIQFRNIPSGGLYRLVNLNMEHNNFPYGRPFAKLSVNSEFGLF